MKNLLRSTTFLAILACILWSSAFVGIKIGLRYSSPLQFAGIRFFLSGLYILPFCGNIFKSFRTLAAHWKQILRVSLFQTFLLYGLFYLGINMVPAALTAIIVGAGPIFVSLMAHLMLQNDKLTFRRLAFILTGLLGVVIIAVSRNNFSWAEGKEFWGILILVLANISGSIGNIVIVKYPVGISPLMLNAFQIMIGGLALFLLSIPIEGFVFSVKPVEYYVSLGWLSFVSAAAFSIWFVLLHRPTVKVSDLNFWKFMIPVFGAVLSWIILPDESPALIPIAGMVIIGLSLVVLNYNNRMDRSRNKS